MATGWNGLGVAWAAKGDYDQAITYYEKALASILKTLGPEHPHVATTWNNLGEAWAAKGDYDQAITYFEKALKVYKQFGLDHMVRIMAKKLASSKKRIKKGERHHSFFDPLSVLHGKVRFWPKPDITWNEQYAT